MDKMIKRILVTVAVSAAFVVLSGCRNNLKDFSFGYNMESVDHYKAAVSFDSDKTYKIEIHNYSMDNHTGKQTPVIKEGTLTEEEYQTLKALLANCNFFKMKDSYGFDKEADEFISDIMYQVYFQTPGKGKFISIRTISEHTFPLPFIELLNYTNTFLSEHKSTLTD
jgi:hypothetical protein